MGWLIAIVILILMVVSAGFRKFAGVLVAIGVVVGLYFYFQNEQEKQAAVTRVSASELILENLVLAPEYSIYKLKGRVTNRSSRYTVSDFTLKISMQDCSGDPPKEACVTIAENSKFIFLQIPPQQARDLDEPVYFTGEGPKARGRLTWNYVISEIRAQDVT